MNRNHLKKIVKARQSFRKAKKWAKNHKPHILVTLTLLLICCFVIFAWQTPNKTITTQKKGKDFVAVSVTELTKDQQKKFERMIAGMDK